MVDSRETALKRIDRFVQCASHLGIDLAREVEFEQGCEPNSPFEFLSPNNCKNHFVANYYKQKIQFCGTNTQMENYNSSELQLRKRIKHFVASKADLMFKLNGKEKLRSGIDYNVDGCHDAYSLFAGDIPPLELALRSSPAYRRAHIFQMLKVGDLIVGEVVGKRPFGVFVRIKSLIHGRNLDFEEVDMQAMCHKSELTRDHKSREHHDPIDDFEIGDLVQGVISLVSPEEDRIAISFQSTKIPQEYGNVELGVIEETDEYKIRIQTFDEDEDYNYYLHKDSGFSNPRNVQTLMDVLGIETKFPNSLLRSCQHWSFNNQEDPVSLRKKQSLKWSMETTASGVECFKSGNYGKAMKCFDHALKIYEDNAEALVARGALYANQNKLESAIKDFRQALIVHPKHHNAYKYLKETLFAKAVRLKKTQNVKEAIEIFREVLDMDPSNNESQEHIRELQETVSQHCVESQEGKESKVSIVSTKQSDKFEHVRKLIEADPKLTKSSRKKKRQKRKKRKAKKRKKNSRRDVSSSDESTSTASENGGQSDHDEWIEKYPKSFATHEEKIRLREGHKMTASLTLEKHEPLNDLEEPRKNFLMDWHGSRVASKSESSAVLSPRAIGGTGNVVLGGDTNEHVGMVREPGLSNRPENSMDTKKSASNLPSMNTKNDGKSPGRRRSGSEDRERLLARTSEGHRRDFIGRGRYSNSGSRSSSRDNGQSKGHGESQGEAGSKWRVGTSERDARQCRERYELVEGGTSRRARERSSSPGRRRSISGCRGGGRTSRKSRSSGSDRSGSSDSGRSGRGRRSASSSTGRGGRKGGTRRGGRSRSGSSRIGRGGTRRGGRSRSGSSTSRSRRSDSSSRSGSRGGRRSRSVSSGKRSRSSTGGRSRSRSNERGGTTCTRRGGRSRSRSRTRSVSKGRGRGAGRRRRSVSGRRSRSDDRGRIGGRSRSRSESRGRGRGGSGRRSSSTSDGRSRSNERGGIRRGGKSRGSKRNSSVNRREIRKRRT